MVGIALKGKHLHIGPEGLSADLIENPAQILEEFRGTVGGSFAYAYFVLPCEDIGVDFFDLAAEVVIRFKYTCTVWSDELPPPRWGDTNRKSSYDVHIFRPLRGCRLRAAHEFPDL